MLSEVRPHYGDRRLGSKAIPLAIFLLIEDDVEDTNDATANALFVEAFGDRQKFFNICLEELDKGDEVVDAYMGRTNFIERVENSAEEDVHTVEVFPESQEDRIRILLDQGVGQSY